MRILSLAACFILVQEGWSQRALQQQFERTYPAYPQRHSPSETSELPRRNSSSPGGDVSLHGSTIQGFGYGRQKSKPELQGEADGGSLDEQNALGNRNRTRRVPQRSFQNPKPVATTRKPDATTAYPFDSTLRSGYYDYSGYPGNSVYSQVLPYSFVHPVFPYSFYRPPFPSYPVLREYYPRYDQYFK